MKKIGIGLIFLLAILVVFPSACQTERTTEVIEMSLAEGAPRTHELAMHFSIPFTEKVAELTNGQIQIQHYDAGSLVSGTEILDGVNTGIAEFGDLIPSYFPDRLPMCMVHALPYLCDNCEQANEIFRQLTFEGIIREELHKKNLVPLAVYMDADRLIWTTSPVHNLAELQTKKLRAMGTEGQIMEAMGVTAVAMGGWEWQEAMLTGVVDGVSQSYWTTKGYHLDELATDALVVGNHTMAYCLIVMNEDAWGRLPSNLQNTLVEAGNWTSDYTYNAMKQCDEEGERIIRAAGITVHELSPEDLAKAKEMTKVVIDEWLKKYGEDAATLLREVETLKKQY